MVPSLNEDIRKLFTGGGIVFFGLVTELVISFLAKAVIARTLGAVNYGAVSLGVTMIGVLSMLTLLGLHTGVGRYLPRLDAPADRKGVLVAAVSIVLPIASVTGVLVAVLAGPISTYIFTDPSISPVIRIFGLAIPFVALMKLSVGAMQGLQKTVPRVIVQNITPPVTRFVAVVAAVVLGTGAVGMATAYSMAYLVASLIGVYYVVSRTELFSDVEATPMSREMLSFSMPLVVSGAMAYVLTDLDTFMLGYFSTTREVGIYNVIYPIAQLLLIGLAAFKFLFVPILSELDSKGDSKNMFRVYQVVTKWIFIGTLPIFLVIVLFPDQIISVTFGREYAEGGTALSLLAVAYFSHAAAGPNSGALSSLGYTRIIMWDNLLVGVLNTSLNLILIPSYGFLGAGAATAISYLALNALYSVHLYRRSGIHPISRGLIQPGAAAILLTAVAYWAVDTFLTITIPVAILLTLLSATTYVVIILQFGGIEDEEVMLILKFEERLGTSLDPVKNIVKRLM